MTNKTPNEILRRADEWLVDFNDCQPDMDYAAESLIRDMVSEIERLRQALEKIRAEWNAAAAFPCVTNFEACAYQAGKIAKQALSNSTGEGK